MHLDMTLANEFHRRAYLRQLAREERLLDMLVNLGEVPPQQRWADDGGQRHPMPTRVLSHGRRIETLLTTEPIE